MKLSRLIAALSNVSIENFYEQEIVGITVNSEAAAPGSVFVAIKGSRFDGACFIPDAYSRGARVFVTSKRSCIANDTVYIFRKSEKNTGRIMLVLF